MRRSTLACRNRSIVVCVCVPNCARVHVFARARVCLHEDLRYSVSSRIRDSSSGMLSRGTLAGNVLNARLIQERKGLESRLEKYGEFDQIPAAPRNWLSGISTDLHQASLCTLATRDLQDSLICLSFAGLCARPLSSSPQLAL